MNTRQLGHSDLAITPIGVGAWAMGGGGWQWGWGPQDDRDSIAAIHAALDAGLNWIDTAAVYGSGHSEEVVGRALAGRAQKPYVFTKCGRIVDRLGHIFGYLKADALRRQCEASLRRLRVEAIDLYQIHWPQPESDIEEAWNALAQLQSEGKVRWIGVSNFSPLQMERIRRIAPIASLQPPYSLLARDIERSILPYCRQNQIGVIVYSPMHSGLLSGAMTRERIGRLPADDWRRQSPQFQEPLLSRNLALVEVLRAIGHRHRRTPAEVAIAWTLAQPAVTGAIVGLRSARQVEGIAGAATFRLGPAELDEIAPALAAPAAP
ncbi:MAG: aldo/keto reductase [Terriglobales bacterium]